MSSKRCLLIGCGNRRDRRLNVMGDAEWGELVTLDIDEAANPDVVHDLNVLPYPFADSEFDEIHAYEVLEHCGQQGDWRFFFAQWSEFARILKPGGHFAGSCPRLDSRWAWGDPGHTRVISLESLTFLDQSEYARQVGRTSMTDYRGVWSGDMRLIYSESAGESWFFVLQDFSCRSIE